MIWFLHGNLSTPADGAHIMRPLESAGYETRSPSLWELLSEKPLSLEESGIRLARLIEKTDPAPMLCGYSLGGRLALHALRHLSSCKAVFLMGSHFGLTKAQEMEQRRENDAFWANKLRNNDWADFYRQWTAQPVFQGGKNIPRPCPNAETREQMEKAFECWSLGRQENQIPLLQDYLSQHPLPLILLTGEYDLKFTHLYQSLNSLLPGSRHLIVPGTGHRIPEDAPQALADILLDLIPTLVHE